MSTAKSEVERTLLPTTAVTEFFIQLPLVVAETAHPILLCLAEKLLTKVIVHRKMSDEAQHANRQEQSIEN